MKFKVNKIAAAVAVSLGTSVVGMNAAQADEILFPYVVNSPTVTTILSVINDDDFTIGDLHYRYYYKAGPAATSNTAACQEVDIIRTTSDNDIVTFDVGGPYGDAQGVLFEPVQVNAEYNGSFAVFRSPDLKPVRAFAIVDNNNFGFIGQDVWGEAFIIQFTEGSVWGYGAYDAAHILVDGNVVINPYEFSDRTEKAGEVLVAPPAGANPDSYLAPIAVMPFPEVSTTLFVTPIATTLNNPPANPLFQLRGDLATVIAAVVNDPSNFVLDVMYDRDENPVSGSVPQPVVCVGAVPIQDLISAAARQFVPNGGWTNVEVLPRPAVDPPQVRTNQAIVIKLEYNDRPPATLNGQPAGGGTYNNAIWLRKGFRESMPRELVAGHGSSPIMGVFAVPGENSSPFPVIDSVLAAAGGVPLLPPEGATGIDYLSVAQ
jgi:hypothetical protein